MKKIKVMLLNIILIFGIIFMAGCANNSKEKQSSNKEKTEITMLIPGYDSGYLKKPLNTAINKYEKNNKKIHIKVISVGWDELNSKIVKLSQSNQLPDLIMVGSRSIRQFAEAGILENLDSYMTDSFNDTRIQNVMDTAKYDGKQYGIPMGLTSRVLFYRPDLIKNPPTNWNELLSTAKEVNKNNKKMYGFAIPTDPTLGTDEVLNFIYQGNGKIVDDSGKYVLNSEENQDTLNYLKEFKDIIPNPVSTARGDQIKLFENKKLAMFISGGWEKEQLDKGKEKVPYAAVELPQGNKKAVNLVTDSYAMSKKSKHKKETFKFIEFLGKPEQQRLVSEENNFLPVTKAELKDKRFNSEFMKPFVSILDYGISEPSVPNWDVFNKSFNTAVQKVLTDKASADKALNEAMNEVKK